MWPEILVGIGECLGVTEAARGMSRCRSIGDSRGWRQARPDAVGTAKYEVAGPKFAAGRYVTSTSVPIGVY